MLDTAHHTLAISAVLARFFQAFDDKNWTMMRECLCDEVFADYSSFRNVPAATISADTYVEQRREALQYLETQHNFLNLRVELDPWTQTAAARCNYVIHRFAATAPAGDQYFHSYGHYCFTFLAVSGDWKISHIVQHLLRNHGNPDIHGATRSRGTTA